MGVVAGSQGVGSLKLRKRAVAAVRAARGIVAASVHESQHLRCESYRIQKQSVPSKLVVSGRWKVVQSHARAYSA